MQQSSDIESISAVTLATHDMVRSVEFYTSLGFRLGYGGPGAEFSNFAIGDGFLNLIAQPAKQQWSWWGRLVLHVTDVDALYERAIRMGLTPAAPPTRRRMGGAVLPSDRSRRARSQFRSSFSAWIVKSRFTFSIFA
jgi:catechol 2,3-dioxygenase-like lactoylglutathione lyase family enzyme